MVGGNQGFRSPGLRVWGLGFRVDISGLWAWNPKLMVDWEAFLLLVIYYGNWFFAALGETGVVVNGGALSPWRIERWWFACLTNKEEAKTYASSIHQSMQEVRAFAALACETGLAVNGGNCSQWRTERRWFACWTTSPQSGTKSSCSTALIQTTIRRIPASASTNQGPASSGLMQL